MQYDFSFKLNRLLWFN